MLDDAEIRASLLRVALGDPAALERLYHRTAPLLLGVAMRILGRRELAEEVVHDSFVRIWRSARSFDPQAPSAVAWMVAIARHRALDVVGSADSARVDGVEDIDALLDRMWERDDDGEDDRLGRRREHGWLRHCLGLLKPAERQALVLAYMHGLSHGELARHLARPLGTVKSWVRRGLDSLRGCVEREGEAP